MDYKIFQLGESALTIDFGNEISEEKNNLVINLANQIEKNNFVGFIECVPAYSTLTIFYDIFKTKKEHKKIPTAFGFVKEFVIKTIKNLSKSTPKKPRTVEIPVSFDEKSALDLEFVAKTHNLEKSEVIEIFLSKTYRVFMIGFLPGFAYMGELDDRIATPRKQNPRTKVPKGSVGLAGKQTGIYPLESPGGWQIIGKTDVGLFTPNKKTPTLLQTGDLVNFIMNK